MTAALAIAIALPALAPSGRAVAQEAPKAESSAATSATAEGTSDHGRHHRHKHDDTPKPAEDAAKTEPSAQTDAGTKTATGSTNDSSAVAVVKTPEQECRTVKPTGTRMSQKICATPEQWKEVDAKGLEGARQTKQAISDSSSIARPSPPLP
jgi:hypothetical protein